MKAVLSHTGPHAATTHETWDSAAFRDMKPVLSGWLKRREKVY